MVSLTRRSALAGLASGCAVVTAGAWAQVPGGRFGRVAVDVGPLVGRGGGASAGLIAQLLPAKLASVFADRLAPGEKRLPTLVARIDTLFLSSFGETRAPGIDSLGTMDSMEGAGLVVVGRKTISITPLRVTLPASYSGAYYLPDIDQKRIDSLCFSFASWLGREMA